MYDNDEASTIRPEICKTTDFTNSKNSSSLLNHLSGPHPSQLCVSETLRPSSSTNVIWSTFTACYHALMHCVKVIKVIMVALGVLGGLLRKKILGIQPGHASPIVFSRNMKKITMMRGYLAAWPRRGSKVSNRIVSNDYPIIAGLETGLK